jgi:hypothetical protein
VALYLDWLTLWRSTAGYTAFKRNAPHHRPMASMHGRRSNLRCYIGTRWYLPPCIGISPDIDNRRRNRPNAMMAESRTPDIIIFAYDDYNTDEVRKIVTAKCRKCRVNISEKLGTTSAFVRHLSTSAHPTLRTQ